jgi:murein DD-endopeptidase MepM/ murein hydrolase activator NlpD
MRATPLHWLAALVALMIFVPGRLLLTSGDAQSPGHGAVRAASPPGGARDSNPLTTAAGAVAGERECPVLGYVVEAREIPPLAVSPVPLQRAEADPAAGPCLAWPVAGRITQGFGCTPYYTGIPGPGCPPQEPWFHDGLDIASPTGTPVRAVMGGQVVFAGADGSGPVCSGGYRGYGLGVVVDSWDSWQVLYAHLSRIDVEVGQEVELGEIIGAVGATGCVSGAHLHFGLRHDGELVDPLRELNNVMETEND